MEFPGTSSGSAGAQQVTRFFCHICNMEITTVTVDFTCPVCNKGFIEETTTPQPVPAAESDTSDEMVADDQIPLVFPFLSREQSNHLTNELSAVLMAVRARPDDPAFAASTFANHRLDNGSSAAALRGGGASGVNVMNGGRGRRVRVRNRVQHQPNNVFENIVQDFLMNVTGAGGGLQVGGVPMFFVGNPEDYVYGRDGLDTIVTQLLNQMDGTGPPPLAPDKIASIPKVEVTVEQVAEKLKCSVCWEDFILAETVHKLPCVHIFHENCIVPWLQLHGTCPVCRQSLNPAEEAVNVAGEINDIIMRAEDVATRNHWTLPLYGVPQPPPADTVAVTVQAPAPEPTPEPTPSSSRTMTLRPRPRRSNPAATTTATTSNVASGSALASSSTQTDLHRDEDGNVDFDFD